MKRLFLSLFLAATLQAQTVIYRSIQSGNTGAIASGAGNNLTIADTAATFASALPDTIGVGAWIQYDANNNGTVDNIAVIHRRVSATVFNVKDSLGGSAYLNTCSNDQDWSIFHSYISVNNFAGRVLNTGIASALRTEISSSRLVTNDLTLRAACYRSKETTSATINFDNQWQTSVTGGNRIKIYTPVDIGEVGTSQRHNGIYSLGSGYIIEKGASDPYSYLISVPQYDLSLCDVVDWEGIVFVDKRSVSHATLSYAFSNQSNSNIVIDKCIFVGSNNVSSSYHFALWFGETGHSKGPFLVKNCIFYDYRSTNGSQVASAIVAWGGASETVRINNCTIINCEIGIRERLASNVIAYNNVLDCTDGFYGEVTGDYNISTNGDSPGDSSYSNIPTFADAGNDDYRLAVTDVHARNRGVDLSSDPNLPVTDDITGTTRPEGLRFDRGAHEYAPDPGDDTVVRRRGVARNWPF